jgi:hypothetical protein
MTSLTFARAARGTIAQRGQAMTESALVLAALLGALGVTGVTLVRFYPDSLAAFTIYLRGFYIILSYPLG